MKTILVPIFDGMTGRNLLYTDVIERLKREPDLRIVLIPPKGKAEYYQEHFADNKKIFVESAPFWQHDFWEFVSDKTFLHSIPTDFMRIRQSDWYWNKGKYFMYFGVSLLRFLGHSRFFHSVLRFIDSLLPVPVYLREIYDRWQPDLVFAPTMIPRNEVALMRMARKHGKKTVGMVKSWDNLTSKAFLRFFPDRILVHTKIVEAEAERIYGYPKDRLVVTGVPQYDEYLKQDFLEPHDDFFKKIGADPTKRLITFAPAGDWMTLYDKEILENILKWIDEDKIQNAEVLVRLHPAYESKVEELQGAKHLLMERPGKHFDGVNKEARLKTVEFDMEEMRHLASTMKYSAVTINTASTMSIEAAIEDVPIIIIGYDGSQKLPYWKSVRRYYDRDHYVPIIRSGGATLVKSGDELLASIQNYLAHPEHHAEGRARIREDQCYKLDGKAGERIASALVSQMTE